MDINTIFQLRSLVLNRPNVLNRAKTLLFMPDLMNYFLTGVKSCEYTNASTSQLLDANARCFSDEIMNALSIPKTLFPKIVQSGTIIGMLSDSICNELSMPKVPVVSVASHDTASAVASVPSDEKDFIYISCGTWSLLGTELSHPIIDELSRVHNITNEGGAAGRITFLKNIIGLWLIQESRRQWIREGCEYSYAQLEQMAIASKPFACFIDPDSPEFSPQGDIPKRVREFCERTGQYVPKTVGEIMRCIYESLALKYRYAYNDIKACTKREYSTIHIVGGGVKDRLLCQMTADSCGMKVLAGPIEATVYGNVITQLMASGDIASLEEARQIIKNSEDVKVYEQNEHDNWSNAYVNFIKILHS